MLGFCLVSEKQKGGPKAGKIILLQVRHYMEEPILKCFTAMEKKKCDSSRVVLGLKNEDGNYFLGAAFVSDLNSSLIA